MKYKSGFKYQLIEAYEARTGVKPDRQIKTEFITLFGNGKLVIAKNYSWDGASGPAVDTKTFMRASLVHDALYQLMRMEMLNVKVHFSAVNDEMRRICLEDGMWPIRAWWCWRAVEGLARDAANPSSRKPILTAP